MPANNLQHTESDEQIISAIGLPRLASDCKLQVVPLQLEQSILQGVSEACRGKRGIEQAINSDNCRKRYLQEC